MPMNTANKLTLLRVFLIPVFLVVAYWGFPGSRYVALAIYIVACLTDLLDGYIARHYNRCRTSASLPIPWRTSAWCRRPCSGSWRSARCLPGRC